MLYSFFRIMGLIVAYTFLSIVLYSWIERRVKSKKIIIIKLINSAVPGLFSILIMLETFQYEGVIFDFKHVPILLISYIGGWRTGLAASIYPVLLLAHFGEAIVWNDIIEILLSFLIGSIFHRKADVKNQIDNCDFRKVCVVAIFDGVVRAGFTWFVLNIQFSLWLKLHLITITFSILSLLVITVIMNEAKRKRAYEKILRQSEERYRGLIELSPDGILVHSQGKILFANPIFSRMIGVEKPSSLEGKSLLDFVHQDDRSIIENHIKKMSEERSTHYMEQKLVDIHGEVVDVEITEICCCYEGKNAILAIVRDITARKQAEVLMDIVHKETEKLNERIKYNKLKTEFFANVSHEMKTPINLISGTIQLLELELKNNTAIQNSNVSKYIKILKNNCNRMVRLANNLIDVTQISSGYYQLDLRNADIVSFIENITFSVAEFVKKKKRTLIFDTEVEEKIMAFDFNGIERIILNLLSNAIKFTKPDDEIMVSIYDKGDSIIISVKDTGIGIPQDQLDVIFDLFRQVDKSFTRKHEGSGIGLTIVKSLVNMHSGEISVESQYGKGSEFIIKLPVIVLTEKNNLVSMNVGDRTSGNYAEAINVELSDIYL